MNKTCTRFKNLVICLFVFVTCVVSMRAQTVYADYWDGKMYFKISDKATLELPDFEGGVSAIDKYPLLLRLINQYKIQRIYKPFAKLKTPVFDKTYCIEFANAESIDALLREMSAFLWVEYAEKVPLERTTLVPNDPHITNNTQWHIAKVQAFDAWDLSIGSSSVVVAVVDDAVLLTHEDLAANIWTNPGEIAGNGIDDDGNGYIDDVTGWDGGNNDNNPNPPSNVTNSYFTHGTHCAGIVSAVTNNAKGGGAIAHNVKIMACKGARDSDASLSGIWTAFTYAMNNYPEVISCSWGGSGYSQTYQNVINEARNRGIVVVAAAGNDNTSSIFYPAGYNNVISVASSTNTDAKSSFSNYGTWIDITAPGSNIRNTVAGSTSSYAYLSGTSMACPNVASLAGLMLSYNPSLSPSDVEACLYAGADNINSQNPSFVGLLGAGRINAFNSLQCVSPTGCLIPSGLATTNLTATSVTLGWNLMPNAVSYTVRYRIVGTANWTTVNNHPTNALPVTGLTSCSQYEYQVRSNCASDQSNFSAVRTFNTPPAGLLNYCAAKGNNVAYEWIAQVVLNTLSNSTGANGGYGDFRCISTALTQGVTYNLTLTPGFASTTYTEYWRVWIDFNQNGVFDDPSERVYSSPSATANTVNTTITIPATALAGPTTMRVVMKWVASSDTSIPGACGNFAYGEVEDYAVTIVPNTPQPTCNVPTGFSTTSITNNEATVQWGAVTGAANYNLRWRPTDGTSNWQNITLSANSASLGSLTACTAYEWQVQTICTNGISSAYSSSNTFTTTGCVTPCNAPTNPFTTAVGLTQATFNWTAASGAQSYNVQYRYVGAPIWQNLTTTGTSVTATDLTSCLPYEWQVQTICATSPSAFTNMQSFATPCSSTCDVPTGIQAVNITNTSAKIIWNAAPFAVSYEVRLRQVGATNWITATIFDLDADFTGGAACQQYQFQIRTNCTGGTTSAWSNSLFFTMAGCTGYCAVTPNSTNEWIQSVQVGNINNNSGNNNGYGNFTSIALLATQDSSYALTLTPGLSAQNNTQYWRIWIDWNKDFDFEDAGELVFDSGTATNNAVTGTLIVPLDAPLGNTRMRIGMKRVNASLPTLPFPCLSNINGEFEDYTITVVEKVEPPPPPPPPPAPAIVVKLRVLLEGCYDLSTGLMTNQLKQVVIISNSQPFFREPWFYDGQEAVINQGQIPLNTTDWVLVEAYDPINLFTPIARKAAFIRTDGTIHDFDGVTEGVRFTELQENASYFFAVRPRSHLAVFTAAPFAVPNADWYDFTTAAEQAMGNNQQKQLSNGVFVLYGGDIDHNGIINFADFNLFFSDNPSIGQYLFTDVNKDSRVNNDDFIIIRPNLQVIGINNVRY